MFSGFDIFLNVRNLTNNKYIMAALQGDVYPVEGMTALLGARYGF